LVSTQQSQNDMNGRCEPRIVRIIGVLCRCLDIDGGADSDFRLAFVTANGTVAAGRPRPTRRLCFWINPRFNQLHHRRFTNGKDRGRMCH
jgi:hypothetical protein